MSRQEDLCARKERISSFSRWLKWSDGQGWKRWNQGMINVGISWLCVRSKLNWRGAQVKEKLQSQCATSPDNTSSTKLRKIANNSSGLRKIHRKIWRTRGDVYFLFLKRKIEIDQLKKIRMLQSTLLKKNFVPEIHTTYKTKTFMALRCDTRILIYHRSWVSNPWFALIPLCRAPVPESVGFSHPTPFPRCE